VRTGPIAVDVITKHLSPAAQKAAALVAAAVSLSYVALMLVGSWTLVQRLYVFGNLAHDIPLPRWILLSSLPIGFALLGLRIVQAAIGIARGTTPPTGHRAGDEPSRLVAAERGE
jgi:C4-dicarboxylate transporter DctQ subunit